MKPFKPPTLLNRPRVDVAAHQSTTSEPPTKKRRIGQQPGNENVKSLKPVDTGTGQPNASRSFPVLDRKPLVSVINSTAPTSSEAQADEAPRLYYNVLWRRFTTKKNKTWDGDGILIVRRASAALHDISGKELGRTVCKGPLAIGSALTIGGREVEVESESSRDAFVAVQPPTSHTKTSAPPPRVERSQQNKTVPKLKTKDNPKASQTKSQPVTIVKAAIPPRTVFKTPLLNNTILEASRNSTVPTPRHDPNAEGALVMKRPRTVPRGKQVVDVVVDPVLTKALREHQRAGVAFMYECVMGMKAYTGEGAILADDMGLGKTLQTIALIWTLLKQNPIHEDAPVIKKALIVCPVSLINNWRKEFAKWLGRERIGVFVAGNKHTRLTDFTLGRAYSVMIIGYERLRSVQADLQKGSGIDLVIADEGHRLKTAQNKSALAIKSLNTDRRIILSGTPLQNDLAEFFTMVDFVNPGLLGKYSAFKREFETPILKSRQPGASAADIENGEMRGSELAEITGKFILRRTAEVLSKYLPPKTEYVVFCRPTDAQTRVYRAILQSPMYSAALGSSALSLELINVLKKVCNSPSLLLRTKSGGGGGGSGGGDDDMVRPALIDSLPAALLRSPGASGKLQVLDSLLHQLRTHAPAEKVVLVSHYTATLDVLGTLLSALAYPFLRLDGTTPPAKRQALVDRFNRAPASTCFAFLLSAKAGGVGLNLAPGAARAVLFDADWNPAADAQAMARVHRDGQRRPVYVYRLLTRGALDEKIFQRQVGKAGLAARIVDGLKAGAGGAGSGFTREELRDLFRLDDDGDSGDGAPACQTHELLGCDCGGLGVPVDVDAEDGNADEETARQEVGSDDEQGGSVRDERQQPSRSVAASAAPGFSSARDLAVNGAEMLDDVEEGEPAKRKKPKMLSLMRYTHFDPSHITAEEIRRSAQATSGQKTDAADVDGDAGSDGDGGDDVAELSALDTAIEDVVLKSVLREEGNRIGYVFAKITS